MVLLAALIVMPLPAPGAQDDGPSAVVKRFQDVLISVMKDAGALGYQGRYERLAPEIEQSHDLATIAQIAVGGYWDRLSDAQKASFVDTFTRLSISTYAYRFDSYSGQTFKTVSEQELPNGDALVRSQLLDPSGDNNRFDYALRRGDDHWRIVNIIVDGVSDLALKRAEYTSIIRRDGFDTLIEKLKAKIAQYAKEGGK